MRAHAMDLGVPASAILVEDRARSTEENARFVAAMMQVHGLRSALVVTQPWHLRRSLLLFARAGVDAAGFHDETSGVYRGGLASLRAFRWATREYVILAGDWLTGRASDRWP